MSLIADLKELSQRLTDSQRDLAEAAERMEDPALGQQLMALGNGRAPLIEDIANALAGNNQETPLDGTTMGGVRRVWKGILESVARPDPAEILAECERKEEELADRYIAVIAKEALSTELKAMLTGHVTHINAGLVFIQSAKNKLK